MATTFAKWIILTILSASMRPKILIHAQQVPCFFIFGDSQFDNGNNNALPTFAKANYLPYGIDYPASLPTGRFTNGKNIPDFLAQLLGFPNSIPPFVSRGSSDVLKGLNYASGAAGILDSSGILLGDRFSMNRQLANHAAAIGQIAALLGNPTAADSYLRRCLYVVNMGSNDYINNYYQKPLPSLFSLLTPDAFANLLIETFSRQLRTLYSSGARKVAVFGIGLIGCIPQELSLYPITNGSPCVDAINIAVGLFNNKLVSLINDLNTILPNAQFTYINSTNIALGDPSLTGIKVSNAACCEVQTEGAPAPGQCVPNGSVCGDRDEYIFFDNYHPTQVSYNVTASRSYKTLLPADAFPVGIQRLVQQ
ncbi:GDSL esterase/lipase At1g29670-like [Salvia miltiorrhiza]|uniref:GDSL esterase/lipase At1g29670-like n=1 Tax=Salvia miltiorrhiza TaxID=226208 RepID=UPI0025AD64F8|nr:GDSL esterase/lipase At1g29670-like [Salvia miltiorrhiza]